MVIYFSYKSHAMYFSSALLLCLHVAIAVQQMKTLPKSYVKKSYKKKKKIVGNSISYLGAKQLCYIQRGWKKNKLNDQ